jgi:hypothetical protein
VASIPTLQLPDRELKRTERRFDSTLQFIGFVAKGAEAL